MSFLKNLIEHVASTSAIREIEDDIEVSKEQTKHLKILTNELVDVQKKLNTERDKFRLLFEKSPLIKAFLTLDGTITKVNQAFCDSFGYCNKEVVGHNICEFVYDEDLELAKTIPLRFQTGDFTPVRMIHKYKTKDGNPIFLRINIYPLMADDDSHFVVGVGENITKELEINEALKRNTEALKYANDSIVITNKDGDVVFVNDKFTLNSGYAPNEILDKNPRILKSGTHTAEFYENMWKTISNKKTWTGTIVNKNKNGHLYTEQTTITPVSNGEIKYYIAIKVLV